MLLDSDPVIKENNRLSKLTLEERQTENNDRDTAEKALLALDTERAGYLESATIGVSLDELAIMNTTAFNHMLDPDRIALEKTVEPDLNDVDRIVSQIRVINPTLADRVHSSAMADYAEVTL